MYRFIESICCIEGQVQNILYHQKRVNRVFLQYFPEKEPHDLQKYLLKIPQNGRVKSRLVYDATDVTVEHTPYQWPDIKSLQVVVNSEITYPHKYEDRSMLKQLFDQRGQADDIIIIRNGQVTDSYFSNLAFYDGSKWFTPNSCLLAGTKRAQLLDTRLLEIMQIRQNDLIKFEKACLINAMIDLGELEISVDNIFLT